MFPIFGRNPSGDRLKKIQQSPNYSNGAFQNQTPTPVTLEGVSLFTMLKEYRRKPKDTAPPARLPSVSTDLKQLHSETPAIVWFGHSSYLLTVKGFNILVDPVFSGNASPFSFFAKAFPGSDVYGVDDMPGLDMVILTHDHYDHLDYKTILKLKDKTKHFYTSLGVGAHLECWGINRDRISEFDWWRTQTVAPRITLTATPARHFSGRTFKRGQSLWSSFVLKIYGYSLFLGGDSGYESHFAEIGETFGPFDLAILETGQYGKHWPYIHMLPEETVNAAKDLHAKALLPVHWGKFTLALHPWNEPVRRVVKAAAANGLSLATPMIGEPVIIGADFPGKTWWEL